MSAGAWIRCAESLPEIDVAEGLDRSRVVLGCDSWGNCRTAYLQRYEDDEFPPVWRLTGPDSYDWKPLFWCELPELPREVRP